MTESARPTGEGAARKPVVAITMGDINGIGPEVIAKAFARRNELPDATYVLLGDLGAYDTARHQLTGAPDPEVIDTIERAVRIQLGLPLMTCGVQAPAYHPGTRDPYAATAAMNWLSHAVDLAREGDADAIVTCPINKEGIREAGYGFMGHTDFIADRLDAPNYRMCLFAGPMRVVHNTAHLPLRDALEQVTTERVSETIRITHDALLKIGIAAPRIGVAGLNPHAGEGGMLGDEERDAIEPAIAQCRGDGIECSGPVSPDAVLVQMQDGAYDATVALYHDQGHIPMKLLARDEGVNVTLGIPIVRTSVDHGTAYDISGSGRACEDSLMAAIRLAVELAAS